MAVPKQSLRLAAKQLIDYIRIVCADCIKTERAGRPKADLFFTHVRGPVMDYVCQNCGRRARLKLGEVLLNIASRLGRRNKKLTKDQIQLLLELFSK